MGSICKTFIFTEKKYKTGFEQVLEISDQEISVSDLSYKKSLLK